MKVINLLEPWASLIKEKVKYIETRSWKTNYRGELYICASKRKLTKNDFINYKTQISLLKDINFKYGYIIAKCKLVDCKYMTEELITEVKKNKNEYISGDYQVGRYAWFLEDIEEINPIKAKGQLGLWNYYNEEEIFRLMSDIEYGWVDRNNNHYRNSEDLFSLNYRLQSPKEIIENKIGVCWDQVELERYYFDSANLNIKTYFICHYDNDKCPSHTFLTFEKDNNFYWFEHSWEKFRGIHKYNSLKELLIDIRKKFIKTELKNKYNKDNLMIYEYNKPKFNISCIDFCKHCENGKNINIDIL